MSARNIDQVEFHDVSTYFSEEEWKLLHEWQKELYRNVMTEIHQALISLGPLIATTVRSLRAKEELCMVETPYRESIQRFRPSPKSPIVRMTKEEPHSIIADHSGTAIGENSSECHSGYDIVTFCIKDENRMAYMDHEDSFRVKNSHTLGDGIKRTRSKTGGSKKWPLERASCRVESGKSNLTFGYSPEENVAFAHIPEDNSTFFQSPRNNASFVHNRGDNASFIDSPEENTTYVHSPEDNATFVQSPEDAATFVQSPEDNASFINRPEDNAIFSHSPTVNSTFVHNADNKAAFAHNGEENATFAHRQGYYSQTSELDEAPQTYAMTLQRQDKYACEINQNQANLTTSRTDMQRDCRLHSCPECGKSFSRKGDLGKHQKIHTGVKPFQCTECKKSFNRKENLVVHERTHTGIKPYCCNVCGKSFTQKVTLDVHQRTHIKNKPFQCTQCDKIFSQMENLIKHRNTHTPCR